MHVCVRSLDSQVLRPLDAAERADNSSLIWSTDSRFVVFQQADKLKKINIADGPPQSLCSPPNYFVPDGSWNFEVVILLGHNTGPIMQVS
jgi:hypothetical protein